jgi:hypothetical protein
VAKENLAEEEDSTSGQKSHSGQREKVVENNDLGSESPEQKLQQDIVGNTEALSFKQDHKMFLHSG